MFIDVEYVSFHHFPNWARQKQIVPLYEPRKS